MRAMKLAIAVTPPSFLPTAPYTGFASGFPSRNVSLAVLPGHTLPLSAISISRPFQVCREQMSPPPCSFALELPGWLSVLPWDRNQRQKPEVTQVSTKIHSFSCLSYKIGNVGVMFSPVCSGAGQCSWLGRECGMPGAAWLPLTKAKGTLVRWAHCPVC